MKVYTFKHHSIYYLEIIQVTALDVDSAYAFLSVKFGTPESMLRSRYGNPVTEFELSNPHGIYENEYIEVCEVAFEQS